MGSFAAELSLAIAASLGGALDIEQLTSRIAETYKVSLANGTGAGQANNVWSDRRTIASGAADSLDLAAGLANAFGQSITFTKIKAVIIAPAAANTTSLVVGNDANGIVAFFGAATHTLTLKAGGLFLIAAPDNAAYAIVANTGDILKITNGAGAAATYDIIIIGVS